MASRFPIRAAIAAALVPLIAIAAFGNQWFTEHVRFEAKEALDRRFVNLVGGPFQWRFTPYRGDRGAALWVAQLFGVVAVIGLTFLLAWLIARRATHAAVLFGVWGATTLASITAYGMALLASYDAIYDGREIEPGLNAFWYSFFHSPEAGLWGAGVGLVAGGAALLLSGGPARPPRPTSWPIDGHQPAAPAPGVVWGPAAPPPGPAWGVDTPPAGAPPPADAPTTVLGVTPAPQDAPTATWGPRQSTPPRPAGTPPGSTPLPPPPDPGS